MTSDQLRSPTRACLALPGAGTALGVVAGAVDVLSSAFEWRAVGGTSGGGLVALALAFGMPSQKVCAVIRNLLQRDDLLDRGMIWERGPALFRGNVITDILRDIFGTTRMGDLKMHARVGVASLWTRRVGMVDGIRHPDVLVWRAARATMAIEGFFDPIRLRPDNARTYGDGGIGLNVPHGMWDDIGLPTVGLRLGHQQRGHDVQGLLSVADGGSDPGLVEAVRDWGDMVPASFDLAMDAASAAFPSRKERFYEVILATRCDGLDFGLSEGEALRREAEGAMSARRALTNRAAWSVAAGS